MRFTQALKTHRIKSFSIKIISKIKSNLSVYFFSLFSIFYFLSIYLFFKIFLILKFFIFCCVDKYWFLNHLLNMLDRYECAQRPSREDRMPVFFITFQNWLTKSNVDQSSKTQLSLLRPMVSRNPKNKFRIFGNYIFSFGCFVPNKINKMSRPDIIT